jgi:hypothetical protein
MRVEHITFSRKTREVPVRVALPVRSRISGTVMLLASHTQLTAAYVTLAIATIEAARRG